MTEWSAANRRSVGHEVHGSWEQRIFSTEISNETLTKRALVGSLAMMGLWPAMSVHGQLTDMTQTPNAANAGIQKSFAQQIGAGRGDIMTPGSSLFIINVIGFARSGEVASFFSESSH